MALQDNKFLGESETASVIYHDIFDYPLTASEIIKWEVGKKGLPFFKRTKEVLNKDGLYFLKGKESLLYKKALRERNTARKIEIAKKSAYILSKFPTIKGVFLTGALAMGNAEEDADIDLMIITQRNRLWSTRLMVYLVLKVINSKVRKAGDINQKDKLCLNIWLDESALTWSKNDRNIYSAHEIAQANPIIDKDNIYQRFLEKNDWILDYWPNSVRIGKREEKRKKKVGTIGIFEKLSFWIQYKYMKRRITREKVSMHKAIFHPQSWGEVVLEKLSS